MRARSVRTAVAAVTALAVLVLVLAGCSRDKGATASTTTRPSSTTSTAPRTTARSVPACDPVKVPTGVTSESKTTADVDGDGNADEVHAFLVDDSDWHVQVDLAAGGGADLGVATFDPGGVAVIGGADLDGDGAEEIWARTGSGGSSATILGLIHYADCTLTRVTFASGDPVELAVGGSVGTASGVECASTPGPDGQVLAYTASNIGDREYQVTTAAYALEGTVLVKKSSTTGTVSTDDPRFEKATTFTCVDLSL